MTTENYKGIEIEITESDNQSGANFKFIYNGVEYRGADGMSSEDEAAGEAFRKIDELLLKQ